VRLPRALFGRWRIAKDIKFRAAGCGSTRLAPFAQGTAMWQTLIAI